MDEALKYLNNTLLINLGFVSVENIKEIHKRVIGFVDPVNAGVFRSKQVICFSCYKHLIFACGRLRSKLL